MSKLAAVHTDQPTQGHGTVPSGKPPARLHASPLEAQRAEADMLADLSNDTLFAPPEASPESLTASARPNQHSAVRAALAASWLALTATELEVRNYFRGLPVQSGLDMLARMRKQCDLAAETLQGRMDQDNTQRCTGCGKTLEELRKTQFLMQGADTDPETGVPVPYRFCGPMCIRERNKERMLPKEERNKLRFDGQDMGDIR